MDTYDKRGDGRSREASRHHRDHRHQGSAGRDRRRSRSPAHKRRRSESPREHRHERRHAHRDGKHPSRRHREREPPAPAITLPFSARQLTKNDLPTFEPLLAEFLFIQKQKDLYEMDEREVKGRWKSFVGKWNRGELAEGWYDPDTYARVKARAEEMGLGIGWRGEEREARQDSTQEDEDHPQQQQQQRDEAPEDDEDDDDYGPVLPGSGSGRPSGPGIPSRQDLALRDEQRLEDRATSLTTLRQERKADRALQKERLDDLTPRAAAGTRERQLEKKQLLNEKLRSFRDRSPGGGGAEVPDAEMMGGAGDELEELKRERERAQRKKSEREVRREEMERAKREEVEERRRRWREKEEGTVEVLRELVRQRFGG